MPGLMMTTSCEPWTGYESTYDTSSEFILQNELMMTYLQTSSDIWAGYDSSSNPCMFDAFTLDQPAEKKVTLLYWIKIIRESRYSQYLLTIIKYCIFTWQKTSLFSPDKNPVWQEEYECSRPKNIAMNLCSRELFMFD